MNARRIIYDRFMKPFEGKTTGKNVGVELEFPLISLDGGEVDRPYAAAIMDWLGEKGWTCVLSGTGGEQLFMENSCGDCLSFDNSYNNFEFSLNYSDDLCELSGRFNGYLAEVQEYFRSGGMALVGCGTNPNKKRISQLHVPFATYDMVDKFLHEGKAEHGYPDFPAYLSSVQTHLDVSLNELPAAYTLFARLDFLRAMLFANSPDWDGQGYRLYRDYLWEKSAFGSCPNITGKVDAEFKSVDDIVDYFLEKGMFNRIRNGVYETFAPVGIKEYFEDPAYGAEERDIECYLSFKSVEATCRGTLEVRGDCAQPFNRAFAPPAFNLGILAARDKAAERTEEFFRENQIIKPNSELRDIVCRGDDVEKIAPKEQLDKFKADMLSIARSGLAARGKGEERLLNM
ncbi:MAG: hypothetical protein J1F63_06765 [Oscillospiraceae bacterium]|nr:hypothetical protein [Oscillospiraceae bacterium]